MGTLTSLVHPKKVSEGTAGNVGEDKAPGSLESDVSGPGSGRVGRLELAGLHAAKGAFDEEHGQTLARADTF
jgi:hypothetical protein